MVLPEPELRRTLRDVIIDVMHAWSREAIEQPHRGFGGLPICPFARAARLKATIDWQVFAFDARLADIPALADLRVFEAHPESRFSIGGVPTRVSPFASFQVLSHSLRALGLPRE